MAFQASDVSSQAPFVTDNAMLQITDGYFVVNVVIRIDIIPRVRIIRPSHILHILILSIYIGK